MITKNYNLGKSIIYLISILLTLSNIFNVNLSGFKDILPQFDSFLVFYFAIFSGHFPIWFIFILGFLNDALNLNPLGLTSIIYIALIYFFKSINQNFLIRENYQQIIYQFFAFNLLFLLLKFVCLSLLSQEILGFRNILLQIIIAPIFYVIMHKFFDYLTKNFLYQAK